jgi:site-specific DNA-cytosine methylase
MKVLIACEYSGIVRDAFIAKGHEAISCDLLPTDQPGPHYQGDIFDILDNSFDLMIAHPPCTHLAVSGAAWFKYKEKEQAEALEFVRKLLNATIEKIALENPVSVISSKIRKPDQIIQPYQFGEPFSKKTCLWLKNLEPLKPTKLVDKGEMITYASGRTMPKWYADAYKLPPKERAKLRSKTFQGIADAMAEQWGN